MRVDLLERTNRKNRSIGILDVRSGLPCIGDDTPSWPGKVSYLERIGRICEYVDMLERAPLTTNPERRRRKHCVSWSVTLP